MKTGKLEQGSEEFQTGLPRCPELDGSTLRIVPSCTEAGAFTEANCVTITDGERTAMPGCVFSVTVTPQVRREQRG